MFGIAPSELMVVTLVAIVLIARKTCRARCASPAFGGDAGKA